MPGNNDESFCSDGYKAKADPLRAGLAEGSELLFALTFELPWLLTILV
jgi:hypothetical protein